MQAKTILLEALETRWKKFRAEVKTCRRDFSEKAVHDLRVATRRLLAVFDLLICGMCCLRPGIEGVSENIRIISIVGRYLEHSRIYYFYNNGNDEIYMGSADLMLRSLNHRAEVVFPVETKSQVKFLRDKILEACLKNNTRAHPQNRWVV